jgi:hypothetical protein
VVSSGRHRGNARGEKRFLAIEDGAGVYRVVAGGALRPHEAGGVEAPALAVGGAAGGVSRPVSNARIMKHQRIAA